jgi:hypothetical protein
MERIGGIAQQTLNAGASPKESPAFRATGQVIGVSERRQTTPWAAGGANEKPRQPHAGTPRPIPAHEEKQTPDPAKGRDLAVRGSHGA